MAMYLYNGVALPELPKTGSYIYIGHHGPTDPTVWLVYQTKPLSASRKTQTPYAYNSSQGRYTSYKLIDGEWVSYTSGNSNLGTTAIPNHPFWSNVDIRFSDGELWLAGSAPVLVVPIPVQPPQALSMLRGWLTGRRIARMRRPE